MADEENKVPDESGETPKPQTPSVQPVETTPTDDSSIPEKFKGKTASEIAASYTALEKKLGETPKKEDLEAYKAEVEQWRQLGEYIKGNPALLKGIEEEIKGKSDPEPEKRDDVRTSLEIRTIGEFERGYGIDSLPQEERTKLHQKIGDELKDMLDPEGKKTTQQVIQGIPLDRLGRYLDKAYKLATADDEKEKSRLQGLLEGRQNSDAMFGSIPSSGGQSGDGDLTPEERAVAKKLGVSEEKYLESKKKLAS